MGHFGSTSSSSIKTRGAIAFLGVVMACGICLAGCSPKLDAAEGKRRAESAMERGEPEILYIGRYNGVDVDAKTGLPSASLGCFVTDDLVAYRGAYNATIMSALDSGEIVAPYADRIFTRDSLRDELAHTPMHPLDPAGEAVRNEAMHCSIVRTTSSGLCRLAVQRDAPIHDGKERWRDLIITPGGFILNHYGECEPMQVGFVHDGRTAVFKYTNAERAFTYDLEHGRVIQMIWFEE